MQCVLAKGVWTKVCGYVRWRGGGALSRQALDQPDRINEINSNRAWPKANTISNPSVIHYVFFERVYGHMWILPRLAYDMQWKRKVKKMVISPHWQKTSLSRDNKEMKIEWKLNEVRLVLLFYLLHNRRHTSFVFNLNLVGREKNKQANNHSPCQTTMINDAEGKEGIYSFARVSIKEVLHPFNMVLTSYVCQSVQRHQHRLKGKHISSVAAAAVNKLKVRCNDRNMDFYMPVEINCSPCRT